MIISTQPSTVFLDLGTVGTRIEIKLEVTSRIAPDMEGPPAAAKSFSLASLLLRLNTNLEGSGLMRSMRVGETEKRLMITSLRSAGESARYS